MGADFSKFLPTSKKSTYQRLKFSKSDENISISTPVLSYYFPKKLPPNDANTPIVGIDLGTTRCCVAVNRNDKVEAVAIDNTGERLMPSYVSYDGKEPVCGKEVVKRLRNYEKSIVFDSKRFIGKKFEEIEIDKGWSFDILNENGNAVIKVKHNDGLIDISAVDVSAELLKHIKLKVEEFQGKEVFEAIITVPVAFTDAQKAATLKAATTAGWEVVHLIPEAVAASFAYFSNREIGDNSNVLIFDLGGGTLDVCIFRKHGNKQYIIGQSGDSHLGGRDFDNTLMKFFEEKLKNDHGVEVNGGKKYKLLLKCQEIKETLSIEKDDTLSVDEYETSKEGFISLTKNEFEVMAEELLKRISKVISDAMKQCGNDKVDKVLLVGGGSRMPMIKKLLEDKFPNAEHICKKHPDEVVAIGAANYAYYLKCCKVEERKIRYLLKPNQNPIAGKHPRTHITNASEFPILVKVDTAKNFDFKLNASSAFTSMNNYNKGKIAGYSEIIPSEFKEFKPPVGLFDANFIKRANVYITVYSFQGDKIINICDNYIVKDNHYYYSPEQCLSYSYGRNMDWKEWCKLRKEKTKEKNKKVKKKIID